MSRPQVHGFKTTIINLKKVGDDVYRQLEEAAVKAMGKVAEDAIRENVTRKDYTQADLTRMGHPYARRHGTIKVHPGEEFVVHEQDGKLARSLAGVLRRGRGGRGGSHAAFRVGFIKNPPEYAEAVLGRARSKGGKLSPSPQGTKVMLGRDPLVQTVIQKDVKLAMMRAVTTTLGARLKSQVGIRFST